jgi:hypothetical protein
LPVGETTITAAAEFPFGGGASTQLTVYRMDTLSLAGPASATKGEPVVVTVTDSSGVGVSGATVDIYGTTYLTSDSGTAEIPSLPAGQVRLSAYAEGYQGTYSFMEVREPSGGTGTLLIAGLAIVVIILVAAIALKKK